MRAIALVVLLVVGCDKGGPSREEVARKQAQAETARLEQEAADAQKQVVELQKKAEDLNDKLAAAVDAVVDAQNDDDRTSARAKLDELQREKAELNKDFAAARANAQHARRAIGIVDLPKGECDGNPLAKGCN